MRTLRFLIAFVCSLAAAADARRRADCPGTTQLEMNACAHEELVAREAQLAKRLARLEKSLDVEARAKLAAAEEAWAKYRDAECEARCWSSHDGTIYGMLLSSCRAELTRERTRALDDTAKAMR